MKLLEGYDLLLVTLGLAIRAASALPWLFAYKRDQRRSGNRVP